MKTIPRGATIVVGLATGPEALNLLGSAVNFAGKTEASLVLVHAVEPFNNHYLDALYGLPGYNAQFTAKIDAERVDAFNKILDNDMAKIPKHISVKKVVAVGDAKDLILQTAKKENANAIFLASKNNYKFFESSMSNTIAIMSKSEVPVVVYPQGCKTDLTSELRLLVCDDFSPSSIAAVVFARAFALSQNKFDFKVSIHHLNVIDKEIDAEINDLEKHLSKENQGALDQSRSQTDTIKANLVNRFSIDSTQSELSDIQYEANCVVGETLESIKERADSFSPHFILFGDHEFLKFSPLGTGKISWNNMVSFNKPIIVCKD